MSKKIVKIFIFVITFLAVVAIFGYRFVKSPTPPVDNPNELNTGNYMDYSADALDPAKHNVIFFYAKWCPSCQRQHTNLIQQESDIPEDVLILRADYDKEDELKQKYGVTIQHTFVMVDGEGNFVEKWNALYQDYDLEGILTQLDNR